MKHNILQKVKTAALLFVFVILTVFMLYAGTYYKADKDAMTAMNTSKTVIVSEENQYIFFDGPGEENAYIFYPGAKVAEDSYAVLMHQIAANGMDCYLVKMPVRLAFLDMNAADYVRDNAKIQYENWYIGGHSLGGAMAASFVSDHLNEYAGLILMASYPTASVDADDFSVLSFIGSEDFVINRESFDRGRKFMPKDYTEVVIEGGNHAFYGNYGKQKGDGEASVTREEQQKIVVSEIADFLD